MTTIKQALAEISGKLDTIAQAVQAKPNIDHITAVSNDVLDVKAAVNAIASSIGSDTVPATGTSQASQ